MTSLKGKSTLQNPAQFAKGVGPRRYALLKRLGVNTIEDLLLFLPRDYHDRTRVKKVADLRKGESAVVEVDIFGMKLRRIPPRRTVLEVNIGDDSGLAEAVFFNQEYLAEKFAEGGRLLLWGKVRIYKGRKQFQNPNFEILKEEASSEAFTDPILPVYPLTEGLSQRQICSIQKRAVEDFADGFLEIQPPEILKRRRLLPIQEAIRKVHFPGTIEEAREARRRLAYDELFLFQTAMALRKRKVEVEHKPHNIRITPRIDEHIRRLFPFRLTPDQEKVIREIKKDLESPHPMNRLLQGDVGSGKTVVAIYAILAAVANKLQAALMAPTEILAAQHFGTIRAYLEKARVRYALIVGGLSKAKREKLLSATAAGEIDLVVGTHSLIQEEVTFKNLALLVVDEQHKFGVLQRAALRKKGLHPDCLVMTATPIPRTLTLSVFGDLDVSIIEKMPPGRKPVKTILVPPKKREAAFGFLRDEVRAGRQVFIVYPLVEESERLDLQAATKMAEELQKGAFKDFRVGLVHGRMRREEKERVMGNFEKGLIQVLVATTVVEVGIDIPNASVMVIEHAERFGLSQLHQLRGRIGRGAHKSYCLLFGEARTPEARARLAIMAKTNDGFKIAEEDLRIRGPGEFFGTRQHGLPELKVANLIFDFDILRRAREDAFNLVRRDPALKQPPHTAIRRALLQKFRGRLELADVG